MLEGVLDIAHCRLLVDELAELQVVEHSAQIVVGASGDGAHEAQRELLADHSQRLEQIFLIGRQAVDARSENCLHRGRNVQLGQRLGEMRHPVAHQRPLVEQHLHRLFHEKGVALRLLDDHTLERRHLRVLAEQSGEHLLRALLAQRIEPQLRVVSLAVPLMRILGTVIDEQQDSRGANRVGQEIQKRLRLVVDPVEVFKDHHQRLIETLAQHDTLNCLQRAPLLDLPFHLRQRIIAFDDTQQTEQVWQGVFQTSIEREHASRDFLAAGSFIIFACDPEIVAQQIDDLPCETENVSSTIQPDCEVALNSKKSRDFPTPGSAIAATICPCPDLACSAACFSAAISR